MASDIDLFLAEKKVGTDFANRVKRNLLNSIKQNVKKGATGMALKSNAKPFYQNGLLWRITLFTPYYIYPILHVGFEGTKKNGINYRVKARQFLSDAVENGKMVEDLADIIGNQRATAIINRVTFGFDREFQTSNSLGNE